MVVLTALTTACTDGRDTSPLGPAGSGLPDLSTATSSEERPTTAEPRIESSDGSATPPEDLSDDDLFDPCSVFTWADFPPSVRPDQDVQPIRLAPEAGDNFDAACEFTHGAEPTSGNTFRAFVAVGHEPLMSAEPDLQGVEAAEWGGRKGARKIVNSDKGRVCTGLIPVGAAGVGVVSVLNSAAPNVDSCTVLDVLLTAMAKRVP